MVRHMNRNLKAALAALALASVAVVPVDMACTSSSGPPACTALETCCESPNNPDPSSCLETAMSGSLSDAQCGEQLLMYQQHGQCPLDGGLVDAGHGQ
jgi:hypothetical protein